MSNCLILNIQLYTEKKEEEGFIEELSIELCVEVLGLYFFIIEIKGQRF